MLWACHHKILEKFKLQNSGPIVLIKLSTIVLKEGRSERGYNPETPYNFSYLYQSSIISAGWHAHLNYDWWRLPSGEAPLALYCWQALGNSAKSLDWTIVEVTLGPDFFRGQCMGLGCSVLWEDMRTRPMTSALTRGRVQEEGLHWGQWEAGTRARDLGWPKRSPRGRLTLRAMGSWDLGV